MPRYAARMIAPAVSAAEPASEIFAPGVLAGAAALVTGGGTGLGRASALELARCGARVAIAGRRAEVLRASAEEIREAAGREKNDIIAVAGDIREQESCAAIVAEVLERFGRLDVLVNNAGGQYFVPAESIAAKGWNAVWRLNVGGTMSMSRAALDGAMLAAGSGTIVNVTLSPHHGMPGMAHSGAARAAVEAITHEMAVELRDSGVSVVAVAAGHYATEATLKYPEVVRAGAARSVPLGRLGEVAEHAWLVALLATPVGRAFNGSTITLDGARDNWFGPWPPSGLVDETGVVPTEERQPGAR